MLSSFRLGVCFIAASVTLFPASFSSTGIGSASSAFAFFPTATTKNTRIYCARTTSTSTKHPRRLTMSAAAAAATSTSSDSSSSPPVVIAGAGVVGCTTAYYLAKEFGIASTLIDPTGSIAPAASGKAGGFLALDWNDHSPGLLGPLARRGFALHQEIADTIGASRLDYRRLTCAAISSSDDARAALARPKGKKLEGIEWATGDSVQGVRSLGNEETIAQVHPKKLCDALWEETCKLAPNSKLIQGKVVGASYTTDDDNDDDDDQHDDDGASTNITGTRRRTFVGAKVLLQKEGDHDEDTTITVISGRALLYACGPWTANIMTGVKYHSVVIPTETTLSQCVFFSGFGDPEVYVRPDQTAYCTGFPDAPVRVTEEPGREQVREDAVAMIMSAVKQASNLEAAAAAAGLVVAADGSAGIGRSSHHQQQQTSSSSSSSSSIIHQACYLPSTPDGLPIMGAVPDAPNCFVATGHSCWGILMGPATGEAMAHLIMARTTTTTTGGGGGESAGQSSSSSSSSSPSRPSRTPHHVVSLSPFDPSRMRGMEMVPQKTHSI